MRPLSSPLHGELADYEDETLVSGVYRRPVDEVRLRVWPKGLGESLAGGAIGFTLLWMVWTLRRRWRNEKPAPVMRLLRGWAVAGAGRWLLVAAVATLVGFAVSMLELS